jgi:glycoprotein 2-beta-D-xylosyltransferase
MIFSTNPHIGQGGFAVDPNSRHFLHAEMKAWTESDELDDIIQDLNQRGKSVRFTIDSSEHDAIRILLRKKGLELRLPKDFFINLTGSTSLPYTVLFRIDKFRPLEKKPAVQAKPNWRQTLPDRILDHWRRTVTEHCQGNFQGHANEFVLLKDVIVDPSFSVGKKGGENIADVIQQKENEEYYKVRPGFFQLKCDTADSHRKQSISYRFTSKNHMNSWITSIKLVKELNKSADLEKEFTLAIQRYEYANLYHSMTDFYNTFLMMRFFNRTPSNTKILIIDGHPNGLLDSIWSVLFDDVQRAGHMKRPTRFKELVWAMQSYNSPMVRHRSPGLPLVEDFSQFFLTRYNIISQHTLHCDQFNVLFVWRRDYVSHPRNPKGKITRKIKNEVELIDTIKSKYPNFTVRGVQIDLFDMKKQLKLIASTDVLIGMHGAGLSHTLFLPKHAGLIEFYPTYWSIGNIHFRAMAKWRNLHYMNWVNRDRSNEGPKGYTRIPPNILLSYFRLMVERMCKHKKDTWT